MASTRFMPLKLIIRFLCPICVFILLFPFNSVIAQQFVIQVAASKTPMDIQKFSKKYNISESITEVKYEDWYRYFIGNFVDLRSASKFAGEVALRSGITGVFPRKLEEKSESYVKEPKEIPTKLVEKPSALTAPKDSGLIITQKPGRKYNELFIRILGNKNFIKKAFNYPIILLFIFLTIFFVLNILMALLVLQFSSRQKNLKERYISIFKSLYEEVLRSYLFSEITWEETLIKLKDYKKPLNRKILTSVLLNFRENLRGEMDNSIPEIFVRLGLHKDALKSTKSMFYANKVRGIRELTNLYPKGAEEIIQYYINSPRELVRVEAQISYIRLHPEKPFDF